MPLEGFSPHEPSSFDPATDWAQKMHREAFARRRMLTTPDTLTKQTTQGVFHRPKPVDQNPSSGEQPPITSFSFEARFTFEDSLNRYQMIDFESGTPRPS